MLFGMNLTEEAKKGKKDPLALTLSSSSDPQTKVTKPAAEDRSKGRKPAITAKAGVGR